MMSAEFFYYFFFFKKEREQKRKREYGRKGVWMGDRKMVILWKGHLLAEMTSFFLSLQEANELIHVNKAA